MPVMGPCSLYMHACNVSSLIACKRSVSVHVCGGVSFLTADEKGSHLEFACILHFPALDT